MAVFAAQLLPFVLAGAGASIADTSINLVEAKKIDGTDLTMADLGSICYVTLEPGVSDKEEQISFTGITQNVNGSATLTGVKSVLFTTPFTETSGLNKSHSGGTKCIISNTSGFYNALFSSINKYNITVSSTANLTLANVVPTLVVDGYTLVSGDSILLKNQTDQTENGIYIVQSAGDPVRAGFFNTDTTIRGSVAFVQFGTLNGATIWRNTNTSAITIGATNITFDDYVKSIANVGTGTGLFFRDKVAGAVSLKTLKEGTKITITNNADDVTVNTTAEINTASNVGTGAGTIFKQKTVEDLELKTIKAGTNITVTNNADDITISSTDTGEVNTASNVGAGTGLYKQKTGSDLEFKSLIAGSGVSIVDNGDDLTLNVSPSIAVASGAEVNAGTDNLKYVTSKSIADSDVAFISNIPVKAIGSDINTGTDTVKYTTSKAIADSNISFPTKTETLTNKRTNPRVVSATSYTTDTGTSLNIANCDEFVITAQAGDLKFNNPGGTPVEGQKLIIRIKDNATARALTYDTQFRASSDLSLPSTTVLSKTLYMGFVYNNTDTKWDLLAVLNNF